MKKIVAFVTAIIILACTFSSCGHQHHFGEWKVLKTATCTEDGLEARYCDCGEKQSEVIYVKRHNYINGVCVFCNEEWNPYACEHKNIVTVPDLAPTCTRDGYTQGEYCDDCKAILVKSIILKGDHNFVDGFCIVCGTSSNLLIMEAEYTYMDNVKGAGLSDNTSGLCMIYGYGSDSQKEMWSNGYYVGYMYNTSCVLTFEFESNAVTTADLTFRLGCEMKDLVIMSGDNLDILVNGEAQSFCFSITCSNMYEAKFYDYKISNVKLQEGYNKIEIKVLSMIGTLVDYVEVDALDSTVELSWEPREDNPYRRDNEV